MSTVIVVNKGGFAAIGADTLTTLGTTLESARYVDNHSKIISVGDSFLAFCGHASFGLVLESYFDGLESVPALDSPRAVFEAARAMHASLKEDYYLNPAEDEDDPFESSQVDLVLANASGIYGLYSLRSVNRFTRFYAFGSGYRFALGAMHAVYDSSLSAEEIAAVGLKAACEFDDGSELPVEIRTVELRPGAAP